MLKSNLLLAVYDSPCYERWIEPDCSIRIRRPIIGVIQGSISNILVSVIATDPSVLGPCMVWPRFRPCSTIHYGRPSNFE